jgi:hypothetical protein
MFLNVELYSICRLYAITIAKTRLLIAKPTEIDEQLPAPVRGDGVGAAAMHMAAGHDFAQKARPAAVYCERV